MVNASIGKPEVAYKAGITRKCKVEGRFVRQSGGRGQYGHVWLELEPLKRSSGVSFVNAITGGIIPREYITSIKKGVLEAPETGIWKGYPVMDVSVTLYDGSYHPVDSSEMAFTIAASMAFKRGVLDEGGPVLLEPIMSLEVVAPEEFLGDLIGDISSRRGKVLSMEVLQGTAEIKAEIPLAEMFGYSTVLRSITQGRGLHTLHSSGTRRPRAQFPRRPVCGDPRGTARVELPADGRGHRLGVRSATCSWCSTGSARSGRQ